MKYLWVIILFTTLFGIYWYYDEEERTKWIEEDKREIERNCLNEMQDEITKPIKRN